jgi:hypothetical protein
MIFVTEISERLSLVTCNLGFFTENLMNVIISTPTDKTILYIKILDAVR